MRSPPSPPACSGRWTPRAPRSCAWRAHMSAGEVERLTAWIAARLGRLPGDVPDRGLLGRLEHMLRRWLTPGQRRQLLRLMARRAVAGASLVPDEGQDVPAALRGARPAALAALGGPDRSAGGEQALGQVGHPHHPDHPSLAVDHRQAAQVVVQEELGRV